MNVLVTGGAGYIGSHAVRALLKAGHLVVVLDDLSQGHEAAVKAASLGIDSPSHGENSLGPEAIFSKGEIQDSKLVTHLIHTFSIQAVLHFAASIEVGESVQNPEKYYRNNFSNALIFLTAVKSAGIEKFIFSSTAAVYGSPELSPIAEDAPLLPQNPYGRSKMLFEMALEDFALSSKLGYAILRYFNVAGADPEGVIGEAHQPESHLIPKILEAAAGKESSVKIFGTDYPTADGTCVRDYVHVQDLVEAHILALDAIRPSQGNVYNLGSEKGFSVLEVIAACRKVVGKDISAENYARRPGDPATLVAASKKIRLELGWKPKFPDLESIVRHAWNWHQKNPNGYDK